MDYQKNLEEAQKQIKDQYEYIGRNEQQIAALLDEVKNKSEKKNNTHDLAILDKVYSPSPIKSMRILRRLRPNNPERQEEQRKLKNILRETNDVDITNYILNMHYSGNKKKSSNKMLNEFKTHTPKKNLALEDAQNKYAKLFLPPAVSDFNTYDKKHEFNIANDVMKQYSSGKKSKEEFLNLFKDIKNLFPEKILNDFNKDEENKNEELDVDKIHEEYSNKSLPSNDNIEKSNKIFDDYIYNKKSNNIAGAFYENGLALPRI